HERPWHESLVGVVGQCAPANNVAERRAPAGSIDEIVEEEDRYLAVKLLVECLADTRHQRGPHRSGRTRAADRLDWKLRVRVLAYEVTRRGASVTGNIGYATATGARCIGRLKLDGGVALVARNVVVVADSTSYRASVIEPALLQISELVPNDLLADSAVLGVKHRATHRSRIRAGRGVTRVCRLCIQGDLVTLVHTSKTAGALI